MKLAGRALQLLLLVVISFAASAGSYLYSQEDFYVNSDLPWHNAVLDSQGRLLAWYHPEQNMGYDQFMRLDWDFLEHKVPISDKTGLKVYLTYPIFDGKTLQGWTYWQHNPASTYAHLVDALVRWYPYSGDEESIAVVRGMLDYHLAHGTTPSDWEWANVPFATACGGDKEYGHCLKDMPKEFYGGIETDKIGELGMAYVLFYEMTGDRKYLDAGVKCADALAKHVRPGDATHTPWPFRVDAHTGDVIATEQYGGMIVAPVRLFDELMRIGEGDAASYKKARDMAWKWILDNPLNKMSEAYDKWSGYYEDIPKDLVNVNDMTSMMTAYYILSQDDPSKVDPAWRSDVGFLLDRSRALLGRGPFFGAWAIDEQVRPDGGIAGEAEPKYVPAGGALLGPVSRVCCSRAGLVCRTSQWGAINAMFYEKTNDGQARENAFRSLNYATYFAGSDGKISCCGQWKDAGGDKNWFEDGYSDAGRSFMWALAAVPAFAPKGQDHLLNSSSTVQKVKYSARRVEYKTFDHSGREILRLSFVPVKVTAGSAALAKRDDLDGEGYTVSALTGNDYVVNVNHANSNEVVIEGKP
jgi:hypothetical protein